MTTVLSRFQNKYVSCCQEYISVFIKMLTPNADEKTSTILTHVAIMKLLGFAKAFN